MDLGAASVITVRLDRLRTHDQIVTYGTQVVALIGDVPFVVQDSPLATGDRDE